MFGCYIALQGIKSRHTKKKNEKKQDSNPPKR
jgi:hypothetical protein